jgi:hypothetical protein
VVRSDEQATRWLGWSDRLISYVVISAKYIGSLAAKFRDKVGALTAWGCRLLVLINQLSALRAVSSRGMWDLFSSNVQVHFLRCLMLLLLFCDV